MPSPHVVILMPVYEDWDSANLLLGPINGTLARISTTADIVFVDDGSRVSPPDRFDLEGCRQIQDVTILRLRRNLGHQRAIAIGLAYIRQETPTDVVAVMDADGEDRPDDLAALLTTFDQAGRTRVVFAQRKRRTDRVLFKFFYLLYRVIHYLLTGLTVRVGNFSVLAGDHLDALMAAPELWNHYAAAVFKLELPRMEIPTVRGHRLRGRSKMHFVTLVLHGLSAFSVYAELVSVRIMLAATSAATACILGLIGVVAMRLWTQQVVPGWATIAIGILLVLCAQLLTVTGALSLHLLNSRNSATFLPLRDYRYFVHRVVRVDRTRS